MTIGPTVTGETDLAEFVDHWLTHLRAERRLEDTTVNEYERVLRKVVIPELGDCGLRELTTNRMDCFLDVLRGLAVNRQRKAKVVTGAMLEMAVELGVVASNPVRGTASIVRPKSEARALTLDEIDAARAAVRTWMAKDRPGPKATDDMADLIEVLLGTGARIGEVLALRWGDVDLDAMRLCVSGTVKTETGKGTYRKSLSATRTVALPQFVVAVLRRRQGSARRSATSAVFPTRNGTWQQVNNVERRWRRVRQEAGLEWVTPHAFRKSAGNIHREV